MDFRLLGRLEVEADGRDLTPRRARERAVLALLLLRSPGAVGVEAILDAVWGEAPPPTARTALHGLISALRRSLGAERIATEPPGYRLRLLPGDRYDVSRFQSLVEDAAAAAAGVRATMLREALDLFRGDPFADLDLAVDLHAEAARLESLRLAAEEGRIAAELELGRHREVLPMLERLVAEHPLHEGLRVQLMVALYRLGRQADALRVAQDARTTLATELGVDPGPALQRLERQVLDQDPGLLGGSAEPGPAAGVLRGGLATHLAVLPARGREDDHDHDFDLVRDVATGHGAVEVSTRRRHEPVATFAFARAREAAAAAAAMQRRARRAGAPLRIGLHSSTAVGNVQAASRLAEVAHPGQVVLSRATRDLLREAPLHELEVRDLGEHRLADLGPRQPLYQIVAPGLEVDFPPVRGLDDRPTNLPVQGTPLVAREHELGEIATLLRDPGARLVTLTGPGGTGKTRLALHAAAELLDDSPGGTWFVPLEALADRGLVPATVAAVLGVTAEGASAVDAIARELSGRRTLLVLDNFEHLLGAVAFVGDLLDATPDLAVLVTSRVPLGLALERVVAVPPLPVPQEAAAGGAAGAAGGAEAAAEADVEALLELGSVALFVARAAAVRPEFALTPRDAGIVAELCRALDGLPLAIELAASRVGVMSPGAVLERLNEPLRLLAARRRAGPERHQALEATVDWSHDLLAPDEQRLFADLAVFAGGWTLEAAESVGGDVVDVVDGLAGLVDHSLVRLGGSEADPRFGMLETLRAYAAAKLAASGRRAEAERRHASFFLGLAEAAEPHLRGNPGSWLARLEGEHANLRAALDRLASGFDAASPAAPAGAPDFAAIEARLAGALWRFWYLAGHLREGRARLEHALAVHPEPTPSRLKALLGAAVMAVNTEDPAAASERASEALDLAESDGDAWSGAYARFMLANAARNSGDDETARVLFDASGRAFRELGDEHSALLAARGLAATLLDVGRVDEAAALFQDVLRRARAGGNGRLEASTLGALATIAFDEGRVTDATLLLRESLRLHRELGDRLDTAVDLGRAARTLALAGHPADAAQLLGVLSAMREELGARGRTVGDLVEATRSGVGRQLSPAELDRRIAAGSELRLETALEMALDALGQG